MKAMPLPFEDFQGKGVLDFSTASLDSLPQHHQYHHHQQQQLHQQPPQKWNTHKENCYVGTEPTSVLDTRRSPSPPTSSSTLSSSLGNGGGGGGSSGSTDTTTHTTTDAAAAAAAAVAAAVSENPSHTTNSIDIGEKCGLGMEDWEGVLSESSPGQEQSILRLIMGDIEDPSMGLNKLLQSGGNVSLSHQDVEFNSGFGIVDQVGFPLEPISSTGLLNNIDPSLSLPSSDFPFSINARLGSVSAPNPNPMFSVSNTNLLPVSLSPQMFHQQHLQGIEAVDEKPQILNPQVMINQNQAQFTQNPALFMPLTYAQLQEHHLLSPPQAKRLNSGAIGSNYQVPNSGQELFLRRQHQQQQQQQQQHQQQQHQHQQNQVQMIPQHMQQRPAGMLAKQKMVSDELGSQQFQEAVTAQLFKAAELIETGNPVLAQGILARLNHQLSPIGKPFQRAAFYFKEALNLLLHMNTTTSLGSSPVNLIFKIGAYKSFSEVSPLLQFANFTCNQALLEALDGFDRIHVIDFDIGYGGQWASFMQELALRNGGAPSLKITAFASPSTHDELELSFTQENLKHFASEINISFEFEIVSLEYFNSGSWPLPLRVPESEAIAVNLPIGSFSNYPLPLPSVFRFVKQLSPKIVVSLDRGCDRSDVPFPHHIIHALHSYSALLDSLDAINVNPEALQKIDKYFLQPGIEKIVLGRQRSPEITPPWKNIFSSYGFSPLTFSNFTESQAECLVQRTPVRGFHVEKKQSSLVLCWQRKELISASAWRC